MTLAALDSRRLRMLEEMGVRGYAPLAALLRSAAVADGAVANTEPGLHVLDATDAEAPLHAEPLAAAPVLRSPGPAPLTVRPAGGEFRAGAMQEGPARETSPAGAFPVPLAARATGIDTMDWGVLESAVAACRACKLCDGRRNTVFGVGPQRADVLVIGEAPGENEDAQGEPFVGQAGKLLDNMLRSLGLDRRNNVYIANVLKCRPPANRNPEPDEVAQCEPFLRRQVALVQPRIILLMGRFAVQSLLQTTEPVGKLRGRMHQYNGVPVVVTYHPAYLLRNLPDKAKAWADLVLARSLLG